MNWNWPLELALDQICWWRYVDIGYYPRWTVRYLHWPRCCGTALTGRTGCWWRSANFWSWADGFSSCSCRVTSWWAIFDCELRQGRSMCRALFIFNSQGWFSQSNGGRVSWSWCWSRWQLLWICARCANFVGSWFLSWWSLYHLWWFALGRYRCLQCALTRMVPR